MATLTTGYSYSCDRYRLIGGIWVYQDTTITPYTISTGVGKTSVDTGSFQPGTYRVNPYDVYHEEYKSGQPFYVEAYRTYYGSQYKFVYSGTYAPASMQNTDTVLPTEMTSLGNLALQKAYAKLGASDLDLGEDLGEIRETLSMLKSPLSSLRNFLMRDARRNLLALKELLAYGKTRTFRGLSGVKATKAAADTWLELRYGLRPLVYLIGDLIEQLSKADNRVFNPNVIRSVRASTRKDTTTYYNAGLSPNVWTKKDILMNAYASVQYRLSHRPTKAEWLGISPRYWPETAWNLTKLSFVWDWVLSVGPWLQSLRYKPEITVLGNTIGRKVQKKHSVQEIWFYTGYGDYPKNPVKIKFEVDRCFRVTNRYTRVTGSSLPLTPLLRRDDVIDLNKILDSLALIIQRIL